MTPFVLGIMGDSGSGKSTLADAVETLLGPDRVTDLRLDDYHRFTREERRARGITALNPAGHNQPLMQEHLRLLRQGRPIRNRGYDHRDGSFLPIRSIEPREVMLVRGLVGYATEELRSLYDLMVFLYPDPDLLFRWKLRRDVLFRGYTEPEVLKSIARHLLDSKEFVLPQAAHANVVVRYQLPDPDAPDSEIRTTLLLRGVPAEVAQGSGVLDGLHEGVRLESVGGELVVWLPDVLDSSALERWARGFFPDTFDPAHVGAYLDDQGVPQHRPQMGVVEVVIARLVELLKERQPAGEGA